MTAAERERQECDKLAKVQEKMDDWANCLDPDLGAVSDRVWDNMMASSMRSRMWRPLSPGEARAMHDAAPEVPLSGERVGEIVRYATGAKE